MEKDHDQKYEASILACQRIKVIHISKVCSYQKVQKRILFFNLLPFQDCRIRMGYQLR